MKHDKIRIAVVGLGFGSHWLEAYRHHPNVAFVGICDANRQRLAEVGTVHAIERRHGTFDEVVESDQYDAVHLFTAIPDHGSHSLRVLQSGKHCASAIPMAITHADVTRLVRAERETGCNYMLMETECFSATYLYVKQLYQQGAFGELQFMRACHYQNMEGWPSYWDGLPPMYYSMHGLGPILELHGKRVTRVTALGSGTPHTEMTTQYGNPFPIETALFQFEGLNAICEATACLYKMARGFMTDRFSVYGDKLGFESAQFGNEPPMFFDADEGPLKPGQAGRPIRGRRTVVPPLSELVVPACREFMTHINNNRFAPLVHEFVRSIVEDRPSSMNAHTAAQWTAAGICAHESAMKNGAAVVVPGF